MTSEITVRDNTESRCYDALLAGEVVGTLIYEHNGPRLVFTHTIIEPQYRKKGIGTKLVQGALDDVRAKGETVTNYCGFVSTFVKAHPEYADLIDADHSRPTRD